MRRPFALTLAVTVAGLLLTLAWLPTQAQTPTPGVSLPASAPSAEHSALLQTNTQSADARLHHRAGRCTGRTTSMSMD